MENKIVNNNTNAVVTFEKLEWTAARFGGTEYLGDQFILLNVPTLDWDDRHMMYFSSLAVRVGDDLNSDQCRDDYAPVYMIVWRPSLEYKPRFVLKTPAQVSLNVAEVENWAG